MLDVSAEVMVGNQEGVVFFGVIVEERLQVLLRGTESHCSQYSAELFFGHEAWASAIEVHEDGLDESSFNPDAFPHVVDGLGPRELFVGFFWCSLFLFDVDYVLDELWIFYFFGFGVSISLLYERHVFRIEI